LIFFLKTVIYLISCIRTKLLLMTCLEVIAYVVSVSRAAISSYLCLCQYASYILSTAIVYLGLIVKKLSTLEVFKPLCVCLSVLPLPVCRVPVEISVCQLCLKTVGVVKPHGVSKPHP
jgi:hypothetical protein